MNNLPYQIHVQACIVINDIFRSVKNGYTKPTSIVALSNYPSICLSLAVIHWMSGTLYEEEKHTHTHIDDKSESSAQLPPDNTTHTNYMR